jgi:hypothetical protein
MERNGAMDIQIETEGGYSYTTTANPQARNWLNANGYGNGTNECIECMGYAHTVPAMVAQAQAAGFSVDVVALD